MEFYSNPIRTLVLISSSSFSSSVQRFRENLCNFTFFSILTNLISVIFTFLFALVGTLLGFVAGALIGQETESGFMRGAAIGAISGAVFSLEVFESFVLLWRSNESTIGCLRYLIDVIWSLLSGRLVRERIDPAILSAVQSQMGAVESADDEFTNIFDIGGVKGLSGDLLEKIPIVKITKEDTLDSCSVCLQEFQNEEAVRSLPGCRHVFHLACIDKWLMRHGSCPLCRRDL